VAAHALAKGSYRFGIKLGEKSIHDDYKDETTISGRQANNQEKKW
jgi:multisubunit Na+/H+ antiporter MnhG subunit